MDRWRVEMGMELESSVIPLQIENNHAQHQEDKRPEGKRMLTEKEPSIQAVACHLWRSMCGGSV